MADEQGAIPAEAIEAAARAMCDRVNGIGDYDENVEQRRSGWMAQAQAGIAAYLTAAAPDTIGFYDFGPVATDTGEAGNPWREAVIDGLVVAHIYQKQHDSDPRKALHDLICWEVDVALDPRVSQRAAALATHKTADAGAMIQAIGDAILVADTSDPVWRGKLLDSIIAIRNLTGDGEPL